VARRIVNTVRPVLSNNFILFVKFFDFVPE